nr:PKD domain-containing protein [Mucilaginibacter straminoryzae]
MALYITSDVNTSGVVEIPGINYSQTFTVQANSVTEVAIPSTAYLGGTEGQFLKGIHITSDKAIAVYAHIYAQAVSGATLLLPVSTLGKDYQSINYTQRSNEPASRPTYSVFNIIAVEDNTTVEITPSADLLSGHLKGTTFTVTLQKGEVYQGLSANDLTSTHIKTVNVNNSGCKRIAVFSGSSKISISCTTAITADNLFQQVYPTSSWGKNYITVPLASRAFDVYRVVMTDSTTNITVDGQAVPKSQYSGLYYEFDGTTAKTISADKPVQVVQYTPSQGNGPNCTRITETTGDPEMIYLNPLEQSLDHVTLYSTPHYAITKQFINVVIPTTGVSSFKLDGAAYNTFTPVPANSAYAYAQISVAAGTHNISSSESFNAIAYGFGNVESYGYAAGTDLKNLNEYISLQEPSGTSQLTAGCSAVTYLLKITLPYQTTNISWDFKDGSAPVVQTNLTPQVSQKNGQTLYTYTYTNSKTFTKGNYTVIASVFNPTASDCGATEEVEFDFNIADPPKAGFTYSATCFGDSTAFRDTSVATLLPIKSWHWDFGDGTSSDLQNPKHVYAAPGDYNVVLTTINENNCAGVSSIVKVHINKLPVASFTLSPIDCAGQEIAFTDKSTPGDGNLTGWNWDFGDGQTSIEQNPKHTYQNAQPYTVKLTVTSQTGCISTTSTNINVYPVPVPDFVLPDVCLADASAKFTGTSTIADHTESAFTYLWDFGDQNAAPANNTSTTQSPSHKYSAAGVYNVTLTVTSKYGCKAVKTQALTVNGAIPKAQFAVENANTLCSANDVIFDDQSTVDFGNITKVVWWFDYNNHPNDTTVFYRSKGQIPADGKYTHNYGYFNSPLTKTFAVQMAVYSGQSCFSITPVTNIVVNANPYADLPAIAPVCAETAPFQITPDTHGFSGTAVFTGKGVSASGLFSPADAGAGTANINYLFTADNTGCTYSSSMNIVVYPTPTVNAGPDKHYLEGLETATLDATASGNNLKYKWTPSVGLNRDDVLQPIATPTEDTQYTLTVTSADGCTAMSSVNVYVLKAPEIPNTFTPNNDGVNDFWDIKYLNNYPGATVEVFDRNGQKIYFSSGYSVPWDGTYKNANLPAGVYYYIITPGNRRKTVAGTITIIR